jgi:hypothetical protein
MDKISDQYSFVSLFSKHCAKDKNSSETVIISEGSAWGEILLGFF